MQRLLIQSLLMDVAHDLVVKIPKKKLLWMLGYTYDKPGAWQELMDVWKELGFSKSCLHGFEESGHIVLCSVTGAIEPVTKWT